MPSDLVTASPSAEALYARLCAEAKSKQRLQNLKLLWEVLIEQRDRGSTDFSIAMIARLTKDRGGLAESSIRNTAGRDYQALIRLFADGVKTAGAKKGRAALERKVSWEEEMLSQIVDMGLRAKIAILLSENRTLRNELNMLRHAIARDYIVPESSVTRVQTPPAIVPPSAEPHFESGSEMLRPSFSEFLGAELKAIEHFLSDEHVNAQQWTIEANGSIKARGTTIARVGFVTALRKVLSRPK